MKIIITFTHLQIVRNYMYDYQHNILKKLEYEELLIICNDQTFKSVSKVVDSLPRNIKSKIRIMQFDFNFGHNFTLRTLELFSKCHVHSKFSIAKFFRSRSKSEINAASLFIRLFVYLVTFKNFFTARILRNCIQFSLKKTSIFKQLTFLRNYNLLIALSMTDDLDTLITAYSKVNGIKSIGTVRSWDNLTSHGLIRIKPDIFYCHSAKMFSELRKYQYYQCNTFNTVIGSSYWINFGSIDKIKSTAIKSDNKDVKKVLYGAMGHYFNPGEELFLTKLITFLLPQKNIELEILMHPKFLLSRNFQEKFRSKIKFEKFNFDNKSETQSYTDYLKYLSNFDLVISSGSTVLLDACIIRRHIAHIDIEFTDVPYWESIKRYLDFREYYKNFLELTNTPVLSDFDDLIFEIKNNVSKEGLHVYQENFAVEYFMGDPKKLRLNDLINSHL